LPRKAVRKIEIGLCIFGFRKKRYALKRALPEESKKYLSQFIHCFAALFAQRCTHRPTRITQFVPLTRLAMLLSTAFSY
jgi:hypothetical protein